VENVLWASDSRHSTSAGLGREKHGDRLKRFITDMENPGSFEVAAMSRALSPAGVFGDVDQAIGAARAGKRPSYCSRSSNFHWVR
jgi:hypothetical protein